MHNFKAVYTAFVQGEASVDDLGEATAAFLQRHPGQSQKVELAMAKLHQAGKLSMDEFKHLLGITSPYTRQAAAKPDDDASPDHTVVRAKTPAPATATDPAPTTRSQTYSSRSQFTWTGFGQGESITLDVGSVIKERFLLESVIGSGGMGFVFKAKDLRKEEAQDRNPWVAIKVLNEDFKSHPEALKALQREARKSQDLSHPNIITVFDFDRDGDNVYMTMELMEGTPLDKFIRKIPDNPIPVAEALRIANDMGQALSYAHKKGIVHSDFKPGNVFLVKGSAIKVFDFGIARASKQGMTGAQGEMTRFDAGTLGALTPAYASLEMMRGEEPDPRDDIYALACVTYELLTGKHPFEKKSADIAFASKMTVAPVKGLDRKQMRGLLKGLAFERANRSASVDQFLEDLRKIEVNKQAVGGKIAAAVALVVACATGIPFYLEKHKVDSIIDTITHGDKVQVSSAIDAVMQLDQDTRNKVISDLQAQESIIQFIKTRIGEIFDLDKKQYDYPGARQLLDRGMAFYKDSSTLKTLADNTERTRDTLMLILDTLYTQCLESGKLLDDGTEENIPAVLQVVKQVAPDSYLLRDKRLPDAYLSSAKERLSQNDFLTAEKIAGAGLERFNQDAALVNLQDLIKAEKNRLVQAERIAKLAAVIDVTLAELPTNTDLATLESAAQELRGFNAGYEHIKRIQSAVETLANAELDKAQQAQDWASYEAGIMRYKNLAGAVWLAQKRGYLASALQQPGQAQPGQAQPGLEHLAGGQQLADAVNAVARQELDSGLQKLDSLLDKPDFTPEWESSVRILLEDMNAIATAYHQAEALADVHQRVASIYAAQISAARTKERFTEAEHLLARANALVPAAPVLNAESGLLASAREQFEQARQAQLRLATIDALKQSILTQTKANDVDSARKSRDALARLAPDDAFLTQEAPQALVDAYTRLARAAAADKHYDTAVTMTQTALEIMPGNVSLKAEWKRYAFELQKTHIAAAFTSPTPESLRNAEQQFIALRAGLSPAEATTLQQDVLAAVITNIKALLTTDVALARLALPEAKRIFGDQASLRDIQLPAEVAPEPAADTTAADTTAADIAAEQAKADAEKTAAAKAAKKADPIATPPPLTLLEQLQSNAEAGDVESQINLASMYYAGNETPRDYKKAAYWYEKAARQDKPSTDVALAQSTLAGMYFEGKGVPEDMKQSLYWHEKAANGGNVASQRVAGTIYMEGTIAPQDYGKAHAFLSKASSKGDAHSQAGLGFLYFNGFGVSQDYAKAFDLFLKAGKQGEESSVSALGIMYLKGIGTTADNVQAYAWLSLAESSGSTDSSKLLEEAAGALSPEELKKAKAEAARLAKTVKVKKG